MSKERINIYVTERQKRQVEKRCNCTPYSLCKSLTFISQE